MTEPKTDDTTQDATNVARRDELSGKLFDTRYEALRASVPAGVFDGAGKRNALALAKMTAAIEKGDAAAVVALGAKLLASDKMTATEQKAVYALVRAYTDARATMTAARKLVAEIHGASRSITAPLELLAHGIPLANAKVEEPTA